MPTVTSDNKTAENAKTPASTPRRVTLAAQTNWQSVHDEVLRRIHTRQWKPGDLIPKEVELAEQLGCARATVNRALRELATEGFLDRRRKAGRALPAIRCAGPNLIFRS